MIRRLRQEDGVTLMELLVGASIGVILSLALFAFLDTTSKSSEQTAARIDAAKQGRPVMATIVDRLHSTCVAPDVAPIRAGSTATRIDFVHQTGSAVAPTPVLRRIAWTRVSGTEGRLTESLYPAVGGTAPNWVFATNPTQTRIMLQPVSEGTIFRYYVYGSTGSLVALPTNTALSTENAARVAQVSVSFEVPSRVDDDENGGTTFTDSALLRFTPPAAEAETENLPCA